MQEYRRGGALDIFKELQGWWFGSPVAGDEARGAGKRDRKKNKISEFLIKRRQERELKCVVDPMQ